MKKKKIQLELNASVKYFFFFRSYNRGSRVGLARFNTAENFLAAIDGDNSARDFVLLEAEDSRIEYSYGTRGGSSIFSLHLLRLRARHSHYA